MFNGAVKIRQGNGDEFPKVTPPDLRHTAASLRISAGANVKGVQLMLGRKSVALTLGHLPTAYRRAVEALP